MANESIRIKTTPGSSQNIKIKLEQDFDFLEVLSLKITQEDLYQSFCSNYGVVVGRVIANQGFGVPNAKVSIFIPITDEDSKNTLIKDFYPYKTPYQKNSNGIRYNLLLSKQTCILNQAVGSFPSKEEVLDNDIVLEVFEKYYKYTTKTNSAGDFMIFGVPTGQQQIHMDVDLSDIGILSLRPYDMIAQGSSEKLFESRVQFKTSNNLDKLPQINTFNRGIEVIPFWGDPENCEIGITRVDINLDTPIVATSLFFGSIFTDGTKSALNKSCNPAQKMGRQNQLKTSSGNINMIRVSEIDQDLWINNAELKPINLENFDIDGGELIDDDGNFAYVLPLNIGNAITDEFGNLVPSPDPEIGIPTKGMYRFKMKLNGANVNPKFTTGTMFFPSLGVDFGGTQGMVDTGLISSANGTQDQRFTSDINEYDQTIYPNSRIDLDFHTFEWKQIYTIAHFVKQYKKGGNKFSFVGLKYTDEDDNKNPFPYNDVVWSPNIIFTIVDFLLDISILFLKVFVALISICIIFCLRLKIKIGIHKDFVFGRIDYDLTLIDTHFCQSICPFGFLGNLIGTVNLPGDGCGPNGNGYQLDLAACNDNGQNWCTAKQFQATYGDQYDCGSDSQFCFYGCGPGSNGDPDKTKFITITNPSDNNCIQTLNDWKCCLGYSLAQETNTIRTNFTDAWVFGTAYMFSFKYKKKIKRSTGDVKKEKFCGPGADNYTADNYKNQNCCPDTEAEFCNKCLLRGPGLSNPGNLPGWAAVLGYYSPGSFISAWYFINQVQADNMQKYHTVYHSLATAGYDLTGNTTSNVTPPAGYPLYFEGKKTGAVDVDDIIYCNALMSTKIVSLGRVEMCEDTLNTIEQTINASQAIKRYNQNSEFYTGTFFEDGWDPGYWIQELEETSYQDPREVLIYLAKDEQCNFGKLFHEDLLTGRCHEWTLKDEPYFYMKENSKLYNTITTSIDPVTGEEIFNPVGIDNPIANQPQVDYQLQGTSAYAGFTVDLELANRFSPCGGGGNSGQNGLFAISQSPQNCNSGTNWNGTTSLSWPNMGPNAPGDYQELSNNAKAFDQIVTRETRNNQNTKSNIPYYYFGITPGKTAINRLRKDFFLEK